jgi:hypothetical protein
MNRVSRQLLCYCLVGLALAASGCALLPPRHARNEAKIQFVEGQGGTRKGAVPVDVLQGEVMREADQYAAAAAQACDDLAAQVAGPEARATAQRWKLSQATAAFVNAAGPKPTVNALDMVVLATLSRMVVEDHVVKEQIGPSARPLLETHRKLETNAWAVANKILTVEQRQELTDLIQEWREKNPTQRYVSAVRFREFVVALGRSPVQEKSKPNSLLGLFYLDPLAGLDPTARAIEETRLLGERAVFYAERMPMLLSWQAELLAYQLAVQPEAREMLADAARISKSAEALGKTAEQLPKVVNEQREAALKQFFEGVATERSNILASLVSEEKKARDLLAELHQTLNSGAEMAIAVNVAVKSLDAFVHYVSPPETNQTAVATNSQPFNVLDYGKAASQVGAMARDLNTLLTSVNQTTPQMAQLGQQAGADAERVLHHAFRLGLVLILVLLLGSVLAGLAYRFLANKLTRYRNTTS